MFSGEIIDPEIWDDCHGAIWVPWVKLFLPLINNRHGFFQHWPFDGAYMRQPATTMQILQAVQNEYYNYLREANKIKGM